MSSFVLVSPEGMYACPAKTGSFTQQFATVRFVQDINEAYTWVASERRTGDTCKAYSYAVNTKGCKELPVVVLRTVTPLKELKE